MGVPSEIGLIEVGSGKRDMTLSFHAECIMGTTYFHVRGISQEVCPSFTDHDYQCLLYIMIKFYEMMFNGRRDSRHVP